MANYDEDLYDNPFFLTIHKQFVTLFNNAVAEKALVCIPKCSSCVKQKVTEADVKDHVLFPDSLGDEEEENSLYRTMSRKVVLIKDGHIHTRDGFEHKQSVRLLFEETFHSDNDNSYRVLCVDHFLNHPPVSRKESQTKHHHPSTYDQCMDLLWNHAGGQKTRGNLDKMMHAFGEVYDTLEGENLRSVVDMGSAHFTKAMQLLLRDSVVRKSVKHNPAYMESLKVAVETYLMNAVHTHLFRVLTALVASEDAEINKMTRNLASLQLQDLGIRKIFSQNILPAKKELAGLNKFSTPMGRLFCIKRVVTALTRPFKHSGKTDDSTAMMTTDDFLPILIFLIIKSEIPNWMANLVYMRHFHLAKSSDDDEFGFYLASVEAALEHIKSGYISEDMKVNKPKREGWSFLDLSPGQSDAADGGPELQRQDSSVATDIFFTNIQEGNEKAVRQMLQKPQRATEEICLKLCHPLCSCDKCEKLMSASRNDSNLVTAYTRDNRGYTALHMAAYYGQGSLIDLLIQNGAVVDATDYLGLTPLHLACQRGYQNVMLLLLHFGADVMSKDNEGNTPLHHCCVNGHEDCVKALVFYDGSVHKLQVNMVNELGDTALHMASKWGYEAIVKTLLENGANATIKNRKRQSPVHVAQNVKVQRLLQSSTETFELQPVTSLVSAGSGGIKRNNSRTSSSSSGDLVRQESLSIHSAEVDEVASGRVETASLDEVQDKQLKSRKDKLFKAIIAGDIQLVKFYLGIQEPGFDQQDEEDDTPPASTNGALADMCHPLCQCQKCLSIQKVQVRAHQALSVNVKTTSGYTPLHMAVLHGHDDMVRLFLEHGAHVSTQNHKNLTPLHISACLRKLLTMQLLVDRGAKLNVRDINGDTPLLICSASGFSEGVRLLLQRGADVNACNHRGNTALHEASSHGQKGIVMTLLDYGADPNIRNRLTKTAFNLARDPLLERELQAAMVDWQQKHQKPALEKRPRNNTQRVIGNSHVRVQQLFAAFEEDDDLKTLQSLTSSIRHFKKEGSLKRTVTRDNSRSLLDSLAHHHSIESFDQSLLRRVHPKDKSEPMYIYSLAAPGKAGVGGDGGDEEGEDGVLDQEKDPAEAVQELAGVEEGSKRTSRDLLSTGAHGRIDSAAANPSSVSSLAGGAGAVSTAASTESSAEQPVSSLESPSQLQASAAASSSEADSTSEPGEVVHQSQDCGVKGVRSLEGYAFDSGWDREVVLEMSGECPVMSGECPVMSGESPEMNGESPGMNGEGAPLIIVMGSSEPGGDGASENGVNSKRERLVSEVSDIFDTSAKNSSDSDLLSVEGSETSVVSDIFESEDFREGDS